MVMMTIMIMMMTIMITMMMPVITLDDEDDKDDEIIVMGKVMKMFMKMTVIVVSVRGAEITI